jgi:hypothetical protein
MNNSTILEEIYREQKAVRFDMKHIYDALPDNFEVIHPSTDCESVKNSKYRNLMKMLLLPEVNDICALASEIELYSPNSIVNWTFEWKGNIESESYIPFCDYLMTKWGLDAKVVAEGAGLAERLLYDSYIYTLRRRWGDKTCNLKPGDEPRFRYCIKGRTDIAVFRTGGVMTCGDLLWGMEIKPASEFVAPGHMNCALREGIIQLIGMNADNQYSTPSVIVTALTNLHFVLYLELGENSELRLRYFLRVRKTTQLTTAIAFAQELSAREPISSRFASPPTPTNTPAKAPSWDELDDGTGFDESNVALYTAGDLSEEDEEIDIPPTPAML